MPQKEELDELNYGLLWEYVRRFVHVHLYELDTLRRVVGYPGSFMAQIKAEELRLYLNGMIGAHTGNLDPMAMQMIGRRDRFNKLLASKSTEGELKQFVHEEYALMVALPIERTKERMAQERQWVNLLEEQWSYTQ